MNFFLKSFLINITHFEDFHLKLFYGKKTSTDFSEIEMLSKEPLWIGGPSRALHKKKIFLSCSIKRSYDILSRRPKMNFHIWNLQELRLKIKLSNLMEFFYKKNLYDIKALGLFDILKMKVVLIKCTREVVGLLFLNYWKFSKWMRIISS